MSIDTFYRKIIKSSPFPYFYGELIKDNNKVTNFKMLDLNAAFESLADIREIEVIGKSINEVIPGFISDISEWSEAFNKVKVKNEVETVSEFIEPLNRWFKFHIIHHKEECFAIELEETHREGAFIKPLIDNLPFAAWAKDKDGRYITVNKKYQEDTKKEFEEIKGKTDLEIWPINLAKKFMKKDCEVMNYESNNYIEEYTLNNVWYKEYTAAVYDNNNVIGTIGFSLNIDEEKRAKIEVEQRNKLLKVLIDSTPDFIFHKDLNGKYQGANRSACKELFGKSEQEIIGKDDKALFQNRSVAISCIKQDKEAIRQKEAKVYEEFLELADGTVREYETIKAPFFDEKNQVVGVLAVCRDITHRRISERQLRESEEKFRQLAENIEGVFLIKENEEIIYVSPGYERVFERSCSSLYDNSKSFLEGVHSEDKLIFKENNDNIDKTFRIMTPRGVLKWCWIKSFLIKDENGALSRTASIIQDITEIKEAEKELDRLRTEFFANLSHEFRTPLNLIFSSLQMIELKLKGTQGEDFNHIKKYTSIIKQNSFRLLRLVNNLIDTTKVEAGYVEYIGENYDIVKYIKNICESVEGFAKGKEIDLIFSSGIEKKIIGFDLDKMERIMLNLLSNAIKFNIPKGKIEVYICLKGKFVEIIVKDSGIGIPEDKLSIIFERFKQVSDRLTKISEGSGIGLALVKSLVEMHGGTIKVKSVLGKGSKFTIKIPNVKLNESKESIINKNQVIGNSRVERVKIEFSDIYGLNI